MLPNHLSGSEACPVSWFESVCVQCDVSSIVTASCFLAFLVDFNVVVHQHKYGLLFKLIWMSSFQELTDLYCRCPCIHMPYKCHGLSRDIVVLCMFRNSDEFTGPLIVPCACCFWRKMTSRTKKKIGSLNTYTVDVMLWKFLDPMRNNSSHNDPSKRNP